MSLYLLLTVHFPQFLVNGVEENRVQLVSLWLQGHLLAQVGDSNIVEGNVNPGTTRFNEESHISYFRAVLCLYGQGLDKWLTCLMGDHTPTTIWTAALCKVPHVSCSSHKPNLEVNWLVRHHDYLSNTIDSVQNTKRTAKCRLKKAAILRNLTDLNTTKPTGPEGNTSEPWETSWLKRVKILMQTVPTIL